MILRKTVIAATTPELLDIDRYQDSFRVPHYPHAPLCSLKMHKHEVCDLHIKPILFFYPKIIDSKSFLCFRRIHGHSAPGWLIIRLYKCFGRLPGSPLLRSRLSGSLLSHSLFFFDLFGAFCHYEHSETSELLTARHEVLMLVCEVLPQSESCRKRVPGT